MEHPQRFDEGRMVDLFRWHSFDVSSILPSGWQSELVGVANQYSSERLLHPTSVTSREAADVEGVAVATVSGEAIHQYATWLEDLYKSTFRDLAEEIYGVPVACARRRRIGVNLNVQRGAKRRYEAHVDSNPIEGLLYVTTHAPGSGGELVVANSQDAVGIDEIDLDASIIHPCAGHLIFFDARRNPHYVRPLALESDMRIVAAMNFYTRECSEDDRPSDLDSHLFGAHDVNMRMRES